MSKGSKANGGSGGKAKSLETSSSSAKANGKAGKGKEAASKPRVPRKTFVERLPYFAAYVALAVPGVVTINHGYAAQFTTADMDWSLNSGLTIPGIAVALYMLLVHVAGPRYKAQLVASGKLDKVADNTFIRGALALWNLFLTILSVAMLVGMAWPLLDFAKEQNWDLHQIVCDPAGARWNATPLFWVYVFMWSKFLELVDTIFLIVRGKDVNLLHWWHHLSVLMYTWIAVHSNFSPGWAFATVNCFVHCVMYDYYFASATNTKLTYGKMITVIQLVQMVVGLSVTGLWTFMHATSPTAEGCPVRDAPLLITTTVIIYGSYLILFARFYIQRWTKSKTA